MMPVWPVTISSSPASVSILTIATVPVKSAKRISSRLSGNMCTLNAYAMDIIRSTSGVHSCADVTGFGLCGHLHEMLHGACSLHLCGPSAMLKRPAGSRPFYPRQSRNRDFLQDKVVFERNDFALEEIVFDPQTSGGLLVSCDDGRAPLCWHAFRPPIFGCEMLA